MTHKYTVRLIKSGPQKDDRFKPIETVVLQRPASTMNKAVEIAKLFGAKLGTGWQEKTRAVFPCRNKRFARVEIVITS